jgi:hypothetical protein
MNLPIVQRELLVASRGLASWLWRWIVAIVAVAFGGLWLLFASIGQSAGPGLQGDIFFAILSWACFGYCLLSGLWATTDSLTREKTEGTLGLLFLTDLRGYDVVLGKMFTGSLRSFYGVLAVLPVLALPLLMGGVTNAQFWRTVGALLNILIFSLSCGIFFSALCRRTGQSIACTLFFLASITIIPQTYIGFGGTNEVFSLTSPAYAMYRASSPVIGPVAVGWGWYPAWIICGLVASSLLLVFASWVIPHRWQDCQVRPSLLAGATSGSANPKSFVVSKRSPHLDSNPVSWLVNRHPSMRLSRMLLLVYIAISWMGFTLLAGPLFSNMAPGDEWLVMIGFALFWAGSLWFRIDLTRHTVASLSEAKECGALEQILVTPLDEKQFRRGHFRSMVRFWALPLGALFAAPLFFFLVQFIKYPEALQSAPMMVGSFFSIMMMAIPVVALILDIFALYFSGCWFALRNQTFGTAFWKTFGFVYLLPTVGSLFLCFFGQLTWLITGIIFIVWPLTSLQGNFRRVVSGEYGLPYAKKVKTRPTEAQKPTPPVIPGGSRS